MSIQFSIIVPSLHVESGRRTLRVFAQSIIDNTRSPYELLISSHENEGGSVPINQLAKTARADYLVLLCDDMYVAPDWDLAFKHNLDGDTLLIGSLVESGAVPVHDCNIEADFGRSPEEFDKAKFESWAEHASPLAQETALNFWGFPWCVRKDRFLDCGGLDVSNTDKFNRLDFYFWRAWLDAGLSVKRVPAWVYHLAAWTGRDYDYITGEPRQ